jgi:hypothetical protein
VLWVFLWGDLGYSIFTFVKTHQLFPNPLPGHSNATNATTYAPTVVPTPTPTSAPSPSPTLVPTNDGDARNSVQKFDFTDSTADILLLSMLRFLMYSWLICAARKRTHKAAKSAQHLSLQDPESTDANIPLLLTAPSGNHTALNPLNIAWLKKISYAIWMGSLLYNAAKWLARLIRGPPHGQIGNTWFWVRAPLCCSCVNIVLTTSWYFLASSPDHVHSGCSSCSC